MHPCQGPQQLHAQTQLSHPSALSRVYIDQEMYQPENQSPPLGDGHALAAIRAKARNYRRAGTDVGEILQASQRLAHAQVSCRCILSAQDYS